MRRLASLIDGRPVAARWLIAGPGVALAALLSMASMPLWMPAGEAGVDNLAFPLVIAPVIWAVAFFYVALERSLPRAAAVIVGAILAQSLLVASAFL